MRNLPRIILKEHYPEPERFLPSRTPNFFLLSCTTHNFLSSARSVLVSSIPSETHSIFSIPGGLQHPSYWQILCQGFRIFRFRLRFRGRKLDPIVNNGEDWCRPPLVKMVEDSAYGWVQRILQPSVVQNYLSLYKIFICWMVSLLSKTIMRHGQSRGTLTFDKDETSLQIEIYQRIFQIPQPAASSHYFALSTTGLIVQSPFSLTPNKKA